MRRKWEPQRPLSGLWPDHRLAQELRAVSKILDDNPSILKLVLHDLCDTGSSGQGAPGFSAEQVLRSVLLKNWHRVSYAKLAFLLSDSHSFRRFARLPCHWSPSPSWLQENISRIQASTWGQINRLLGGWADRQGLERGRCQTATFRDPCVQKPVLPLREAENPAGGPSRPRFIAASDPCPSRPHL